MRGSCPDEILEKRKQGFSPPDESWYRGPTMDYIQEMLLDPRTLERGYFKPARRSASSASIFTARSITGS